MTNVKLGIVSSKEKLDAIKKSNLPNAVDIKQPNFPATRNWAYRLTKPGMKPAFIALSACLCANGACKLPDVVSVARKAHELQLCDIDISDDNMLKGMFALGDVAYLDREKEDFVKELMVSSDVAWWREFMQPFCEPAMFDKLVSIAKEVGHTTIIA